MKRILWISTIIIFYILFRWDYHISEYNFNRYCENNIPGVFIFERVLLSDEYMQPFPDGVEERDLDSRFILSENFMINRTRLEQDYIFEEYKKLPLSNIGEIITVETSIVRSSDGQVLSKAVSVRSYMGWLAQATSFGYAEKQCPSSEREPGFEMSEHRKNHSELIKGTFSFIGV